MKRLAIILFLSFIFLSGCLNKNILDNIRMVTAIGFDVGEGNTHEITVVVPRFNPDKSTSSETYTTFANISSGSAEQLNMSDSKPFVSGKIEVIIASQELAQNGIIQLMDGFLRDPSVGSRVFLAITDVKPKELLQGQYSNQDNGMFISDMLKQNMATGPLPKTNIHLFFNQFYGQGRDPYLPLLSLEGKRIIIKGLALLKEDKMVETLNKDKLFTFKTLAHRKTVGDQILIELDNGEYASLFNVKTVRSIKMSDLKDAPKVNIKIDLNLTVREFTGQDLNPQLIEKLKKKVEERIVQDTKEMMETFKELNIDPLGLGDQARSRLRSWNNAKWKDQYPNIEVQVKPNVTISETGIAK